MKPNKDDVELYRKFQQSPLFFIKTVWGLEPQPLKEGATGDKPEDYMPFEKGKHLTWQQYRILKAVEDGVQGKAKKRISIASGHGIGKSTTLSWLTIWYLFCHLDAQVAATAPTSDQMHDVLWKEIALWLRRMPPQLQEKFELTQGYIRVTEHPETWFARARTARKEAPEALAGVHGDFVMYIVDEASGVPEEIYNTAEGALTGDNIFILLISNPTRNSGYFYDTHHNDSDNWQTFSFSSIDSPIVDNEYVARIKSRHGEDSDEYRVRVLGKFPVADELDGWYPLLNKSDIERAMMPQVQLAGERVLGVDVAGHGSNASVIVERGMNAARILFRSSTIDLMELAGRISLEMQERHIHRLNTGIDVIGVGAGVASRLKEQGWGPQELNVANSPNDPRRYVNKRAEGFWLLREWVLSGGKLEESDWWYDLANVYFKTEDSSGKIRIMSKDIMRTKGIESPDVADALMLTFILSTVPHDYDSIEMRQRRFAAKKRREAKAKGMGRRAVTK